MAEGLKIRETPAGAVFSVHVVPRASRTEIAGIRDGLLKVRITAPPVDGKANEECLRVVADLLGVKRARLAIVAGETARTKTVSVAGMKAAEVEARVTGLTPRP